MWNLTRRHPDSESLIAHLDGELRARAERRLAAHLRSCWQCRARLDEMETQVRVLARAREAMRFPGPERVEASARRFAVRFQALADRLEREEPEKTSWWQPARVWAAAAAAAAVLLVAGAAFWFRGGVSGATPRTSEVLAAARSFEKSLEPSALPVHQLFRVEISAADGRGDISRLEVWSDARTSRYAARWNDTAGVVRRAVYSREEAGPPVYLADITGADLDQLQAGFLRWVRDRKSVV